MGGPPQKRNSAYSAAHFALELDHKDNVGLFRSVEGGGVKADVLTYQNGPNYDRWRQLGRPKFEDLKLQVGMAMSEPFYKWIAEFFLGKPVRHDGAIVAADFSYKERARREFTNALIKELGFPKLEGQDKNAAYMTVALAVESIAFKKGDEGKSLAAPPGFENQKLWKANNFRFVIDKFPDACKRVTKIDAFTVKQTIIEHFTGGTRAAIKLPSQIDFPPITFYLPEADAQPLLEHYKQRVLDEKTTMPGRFNGSITIFDNSQSDVFELKFLNADISNITPDKHDATSEEIRMVKVDIYTESMAFTYKATSLT